MTYNPGQLNEIVPFISQPPTWLILGGPADADEAQTAIKVWPDIKVIGVEPNPQWIAWQYANGWPVGAPLIQAALAEQQGTALLQLPHHNHRSSSLLPLDTLQELWPFGPTQATNRTAQTTTLDYLDAIYGPFSNALLWLDIEGCELEALRGGMSLFQRGAITTVNVEMIARRADYNDLIHQFLSGQGFQLVHVWNEHGTHHDRVYVRSKP